MFWIPEMEKGGHVQMSAEEECLDELPSTMQPLIFSILRCGTLAWTDLLLVYQTDECSDCARYNVFERVLSIGTSTARVFRPRDVLLEATSYGQSFNLGFLLFARSRVAPMESD